MHAKINLPYVKKMHFAFNFYEKELENGCILRASYYYYSVAGVVQLIYMHMSCQKHAKIKPHIRLKMHFALNI